MTRHRCTGDADTCPVCAQRRDGIDAGPLASDVEAATRADEDRFERGVYGEDYRDWHGARSVVPALDPDDEADVIRQLRADARRILGRTA